MTVDRMPLWLILEVAAMRPVVEAAQAIYNGEDGQYGRDRLFDALDAFDAFEATKTVPVSPTPGSAMGGSGHAAEGVEPIPSAPNAGDPLTDREMSVFLREPFQRFVDYINIVDEAPPIQKEKARRILAELKTIMSEVKVSTR